MADRVRITVDLDRADYQRMRRLVDALAADTDIPTLPQSAVWRTLLRVAADRPELRALVAAYITQTRVGER